jgi:hypothetical protein
LPDGQLSKTLSIPARKNILIYRIVVSDYTQGHPGPAKGAVVRRHERGPGCGGRSKRRARKGSRRADALRERHAVCGRTAIEAYGQTVWSRLSMLQPSLAEMHRGSTGSRGIADRQATETRRKSSPGRARHTPSDHRAGKAGCSVALFFRCALRVHFMPRSGPMGASRHPVFPAPFAQTEGQMRSKARAKQAARRQRRVGSFGGSNAATTVNLCPSP